MNPSFSIAHIRDLMPMFHAKSAEVRPPPREKSTSNWSIGSIPLQPHVQLCDTWLCQVSKHQSGETTIDVLKWLSRTALDMIGLVGFNYDFNSIAEGETNELAQAFHELVKPAASDVSFGVSFGRDHGACETINCLDCHRFSRSC